MKSRLKALQRQKGRGWRMSWTWKIECWGGEIEDEQRDEGAGGGRIDVR